MRPRLLLAAGGSKCVVRVIDPAKGALVMDFAGHGDAVTALATHPLVSHVIASSSRDHSIRLWNARDRTCLVRKQSVPKRELMTRLCRRS